MLFLDFKSTSTFALTAWVSPYYLWLAFIILDRVGFSEEIDFVKTKEPVDVKDEELKAAFTQRRIMQILFVLDQLAIKSISFYYFIAYLSMEFLKLRKTVKN